MALPSSIYRVALQLSDVDRGVYDAPQVTVARHPSETEERLVARLLAFVLFYEPEIAFTRGVGAGDEPDLWVKGPDGRIQLWLEVGLPDADRLVKASRHAEQVGVVAGGKALLVWEQHLHKLDKIQNISIICFEQSFIGGLVPTLDRVVSWAVTISDGMLYLDSNGKSFEAELRMCRGSR